MDIDIILLVVHVLIALAMITLILLQKGKGAAEGATFGGGGAGSVFGASGSSNFLSKTTAILATVFFANSLLLAYLAVNREDSGGIIDTIVTQEADEAAVINAVEELIPPAVDAVSDVPPPPAEDMPVDAGSEIPPPAE